MKLLVGLGNPGREYAGNRHNFGFMAIDAIARAYGFGPFRNKFQGRMADGSIGGERTLLLMPETYMNRSGQSVGEASRFLKIPLSDIIVFHDDLDLAFGKVKVKQGGGHGGHNGLRDLDAHLGPAYWRVRLGIGHPGDKARVHGYVLSDFPKAEQGDVEQLLKALADTAPLLIAGKSSDMMTRLAATMRAKTVTVNAANAKHADSLGARRGDGPKPKQEPSDTADAAQTSLAAAFKNALFGRRTNDKGTG